MKIGEKIQALRKNNGLSQDALAEKLCVSRQAVSKWESGLNFPETEKIVMLSKIFSVSVEYLLNTEENAKFTQKTEANEEKVESAENHIELPDKKSKNLKNIYSLIHISIFVLSLFFIYNNSNNIRYLENRVERLEREIGGLESKINSFYSLVNVEKDSSNQLVYQSESDIYAIDIEKGIATYIYTIVPKSYREGDLCAIVLDNKVKKTRVEGLYEDGSFNFKFEVDSRENYDVTAVFTQDNVEKIEEVDNIYNSNGMFEASINAYSKGYSYTHGSDSINMKDVVVEFQSADLKTLTQSSLINFKSGSVSVYINDKIIQEIPINIEVNENKVDIPLGNLELKENSQLKIIATVFDSLDRKHTRNISWLKRVDGKIENIGRQSDWEYCES